MRHLENMAKVLLATGLLVTYGYCMEAFLAWYSANTYEEFMIKNRMTGPYWHTYWLLILCNCLTVQLLWIKPGADERAAAVRRLDRRSTSGCGWSGT